MLLVDACHKWTFENGLLEDLHLSPAVRRGWMQILGIGQPHPAIKFIVLLGSLQGV